jgi:hypothetical protein
MNAAHLTDVPPYEQRRVKSLKRLEALRDLGAITDEEHEAEKTHVIENGA